MRLENNLAIVTGGARGIGRAIALAFAKEGADVTAVDQMKVEMERVAEEIRALGRRSLAIQTDVSNKARVEAMVQETVDAFGRVDILVNSAGVSMIMPFLELEEEEWNLIHNVNLKGVYFCCQAVIPYMIRQGKGKIINIASKSGKTGNSWQAAYCASKFGVIGLTQSLALEFAPHKINVNAICPGVVFTDMWDAQLPQYAKKKGVDIDQARNLLINKIPLGRPASVEDVANLAIFLASAESDYMTGQAINLTGGQELH
jgi:acetoin reductase-like protein